MLFFFSECTGTIEAISLECQKTCSPTLYLIRQQLEKDISKHLRLAHVDAFEYNLNVFVCEISNYTLNMLRFPHNSGCC